MVSAGAEGCEVGVVGLAPLHWARRMAHADETWTKAQCRKLLDTYLTCDGTLPVPLAAPDWQVNPALLALRLPERYRYSSTTRGKLPYLPQLQGIRSQIPEVLTTLPTLDELLRRPGVSLGNAHEYLYAESLHVLPAGHVFAVSAEHEGLERLELTEKLLMTWKAQDGSVRALGDVLKEIEPQSLPVHRVGWGTVEGGEGHMAMQSLRVPA